MEYLQIVRFPMFLPHVSPMFPLERQVFVSHVSPCIPIVENIKSPWFQRCVSAEVRTRGLLLAQREDELEVVIGNRRGDVAVASLGPGSIGKRRDWRSRNT